MKTSAKYYLATFILLGSLIFNGCTYKMGGMGAEKDKKNQQTIEIQIDSLSVYDPDVKQSLKKLINKNVVVYTFSNETFYGTLIRENMPEGISIIPKSDITNGFMDEKVFKCSDIKRVISFQGPKIRHSYTIFGTILGFITDGIIVILILGFPYLGAGVTD